MSGCAHNGILNILEAYHTYFDKQPSKVISGFHMMKKEAFDIMKEIMQEQLVSVYSGMTVCD